MPPWTRREAATSLVAVGLLASCSDSTFSNLAPRDATELAQAAGEAAPPSYQRDVRPLLEANCVECHKEGGIGPMRLDDWSFVRRFGNAIVSSVNAGRMPPWPARESCHESVDSRALSPAAKQTLVDWRTAGFPEGNVADYRAPVQRRSAELGAPSRTLAGAAYTPALRADTYRCFYIGALEANTYLTALDIIPGVRAEVHHAQLHRIEPWLVPRIEKLEAADLEGGYPCSAVGVAGTDAATFVPSQNLFSYRPGSLAVLLNPGDAVYLTAGSGLVLQVHYNTQFLPADRIPEPDETRVAMWTLPEGSVPEHVIYRTGIHSPLSGKGDGTLALVRSSKIPAGAEHVVGETDLPMSKISKIGSGTVGLDYGLVSGYVPGEIVGITPHAHAWATRMTASLTSQGAESCLLDVPEWDYDWQLDYMYKQAVPYGPDDVLHVECNYANTADHQPVLDGRAVPVRDITSGENTLNEMCLHYLWLRFKYADFAGAKLAPAVPVPVAAPARATP